MMQHVPVVLVNNSGIFTGTNVNSATVNQLIVKGRLANGSEKVITADTDIDETIKELLFGLVSGTTNAVSADGTLTPVNVVEWSTPIQRKSVKNVVANAFVAPIEDKVTINFGSFVPEVGHRYVLRIQRNDIYEHPGAMTYSYDHVASTASLTDLIAAFVKQINKDQRPGVVATSTATTLVITAQPKEYKKYEGYSQVAINAFMYRNIPSGLVTSTPYQIPGISIDKVNGTPGKGNPAIVNDRENAALGYRGITYRENVVYPFIAPALNANLANNYNEFVVEYDNIYRSNDNQYLKDTPLSIEVYSTSDVTSLEDIVKAFMAL